MDTIPPFVKGSASALAKLNEIVKLCNELRRLTGDDFITVNHGVGGYTIGLNLQAVINRIPKTAGTQVRRARTTAAAGSGTTITANLYDDAGVEQTTGDEAGITVECTVVPVLADDTNIFVVQLPYSSTVDKWYCLTPFQSLDVCDS